MPHLLRGSRRGLRKGSFLEDLSRRIQGMYSADLVFYTPMQEVSGATADDVSPTNANCTYVGSPLLAQPGTRRRFSVKFDGSTAQRVTVPVATLDGPFDPAECTIFVIGKVANAGVWTDGTLDALCEFGAGATGDNRYLFARPVTNNTLQITRNAGGVGITFTKSSVTTLDFFSLALTLSATLNKSRGFYCDTQMGADNVAGTFTGALANAWTAIGDFISTGANPWNGWIQDVAIWKRFLNPSDVKYLWTGLR